MKIAFYLVTFYLALLGILAFFFDYQKLASPLKFLLGAIAVACVVFSIMYEHREKQVEQKEKQISEYVATSQRQDMSKKLDDLKKKEKRGLLEDSDYLRYVVLYLEKLELSVSMLNSKFNRDYILGYFDDVKRLPVELNYEEWSSSEALI